MVDETEDFFQVLASRGIEPLLANVTGTLRFDLVHDKQTDIYLVTVAKGRLQVSREAVDADCVVRTEKPLFDSIVSGKRNAMAATLRGELQIQGEPAILVSFQRLFPAAFTSHGNGASADGGSRKS